MAKEKKNIALKINGKNIKLNPFASNIIYNIVSGIIASLTIDEDPEIIDITIKK